MADTCVAHVPVFAALAPEDQARVAALARPTRLAAGEATGDEPRLVVVHEGRLKITRVTSGGTEQIVRVLGPGEFTGESAVLTGRRPDVRAVALEDSRLCVFRHEDLDALVRTHPEVGIRMLATVSERLAETEERLTALTSRGVTARLADYLLGLPSTWHDGVATVRLPLAKKDVASLLDTSPESLSRALASLTRQGVVAARGRTIEIRSPGLLQELVDA